MIKDKRAFVRVLEAIIAIIILLGFFIFTMLKQKEKPDIADEIYNLERRILEDVSDSTMLREAVLLDDNATINYFVASRLYPAHTALNFSIAICNPPGEECILSPRPVADIYVDDIIIGSLLKKEQPPKVLRLFVWIETERKVEAPPAVCGNNKTEGREECDDGNTISGDGCSADCKIEVPPTCDGYPGYPLGTILTFGTDVGVCEFGEKNCTETGWVIIKNEVVGSDEVCDNLDNNCDGTTDGITTSCYTGPAGTENVGICYGGTKTCTVGSWGSCVGQQLPEEENSLEDCTDGLDNDCDGYTDIDEPDCAVFY